MMKGSVLDQLNNKTGILFDANQFLYRTYHILKSRSNGELTYGFIGYSFISQLRAALVEMSAVNSVPFIIWDSPTSRNSRLSLYSDYKGNRSPSPDILRTTRQLLQTEFEAICPRLNLSYPDIEADDIIGITVTTFKDLFARWIIVSRDEDLVQCVDDNVDYFNPYTKVLDTKETLLEKYGFSLEKIPIYKALVGDTADNWKGVNGVGKKTVPKWLCQPGSLVDIIQDIHDNKLKTAEKRNTFLTGLQLCKIPILDDCKPVVDYMIRKMSVVGNRNFDHLHKVFEINDKSKAIFPIGDIGPEN